MEDQICSPEKYSMKNHIRKTYFIWIKKKYDKNISYWIQIYFDSIKIYFDIMKKSWYHENIFYWIQIYFDIIKINFGIMKKKVI